MSSRDFWGLCVADFVRGLDQVGQFGLGVVGRDAATSVPEQVLTILEGHACGAQPAAEGVFEIVDANVSEAYGCRLAVLILPLIRRAFPGRSPGRVVDLG